MNWKKFKALFKSEKKDETRFIVGLDLGNATSAVAYFDVGRNVPEIIDISGGYGKPSVPTVMQYIYDTKEWVFGEYAVLNRGESKDIYLSSLIESLGKKEYIEIDNRPISVVNILGLYLKELLGNIKNINPKADIVGIIVSISSYLGSEAKSELFWAFKSAGYEKELIDFVPDRECIFAKYYFDKNGIYENSGKILLLDFGSRELRGGVYDVEPEGENIKITSKLSMFEENLGTNRVDETVYRMILQMYCTNMNISSVRLPAKLKEQLSSFAYQHKDLLFQKRLNTKQIRLYFNFAYPPFQQAITKSEADEIIKPLKKDFVLFVHKVLGKNLLNKTETIQTGDISTVICVGGGFEMLWARETIESIFPSSNLVFYKNAKCAIAEGAAIVAADKLDVINAKRLMLEDKNQILKDIGIKVLKDKKEKFIAIVEKNSFWWQHHGSKMLIINEKTDRPISIEICERDTDGDVKLLKNIWLEGMPKRPKGTTKIKLSMEYKSYSEIEITIKDYGFGEFFKKTNYERKFNITMQ